MNKIRTKVLLAMVFTISLFFINSCKNRIETDKELTYLETNVKGNNKISMVSSDIFLEGSIVVPDGKTNIKSGDISDIRDILPNDFVLISHIAVNLNDDNALEHIILYSTKDEEKVNISIASLDSISKRYNFIWKEETSSTNIDSHSEIEIVGITSDFQNDIVVLGNSNNKKTLDLFTMDNKSDLKSYKNIFSAEGTDVDLLELNQQKYSEFQEFQNVFSSAFQIVILNTRDDGYFEREYYKWNADTKNIEKFSEEVFNQEDVSQEKLSKLGKATEEDIKKFLEGAWYKVSDKGNIELSTTVTEIQDINNIGIVFSDKPFGLLFYDNVSQNGEAYWYEWKSSFRQYPRYVGGITLRINIKSNILPSISDWILLDIISGESFYLNVRGTLPNIFSGEYKKIRNDKDLTNFTHKEIGIYSNSLKKLASSISGLYINSAQNNNYLFEYPNINIATQNSTQVGIYSLLQIGEILILELRIKDQDAKFYRVDKCTKEEASKLCEELVLIPIYMFSDGVYLNKTQEVLELKLDSKN